MKSPKQWKLQFTYIMVVYSSNNQRLVKRCYPHKVATSFMVYIVFKWAIDTTEKDEWCKGAIYSMYSRSLIF